MVPRCRRCGRSPGPAPRTRGDGPRRAYARAPPASCSPRPRGWSRHHPLSRVRHPLLPAPAGMVPRLPRPRRRRRPALRTRGDGPPTPRFLVTDRCCFRTRGDGPRSSSASSAQKTCSPHPREWSRAQLRPPLLLKLLPAPAGIVPRRSRRSGPGTVAPRTRGDGPHTNGCIARPRLLCSPHPAGMGPRTVWSRPHRAAAPRPAGMVPRPGRSPAPAGMVPRALSGARSGRTAPRTCGGSPKKAFAQRWARSCSPHPRGWSQGHGAAASVAHLLPAPAGMVPRSTSAPPCSFTAPRTRGDGPDCRCRVVKRGRCSPHPRGWSHRAACLGAADPLLPAPAGMVPAPRATGLRCPAPCTRGDGPRVTECGRSGSTAPRTRAVFVQ